MVWLLTEIVLLDLLLQANKKVIWEAPEILFMELTLAVPTLTAVETYMYTAAMWGKTCWINTSELHTCIAKQRLFSQHQITTAVYIWSYILCNGKTQHQPPIQWDNQHTYSCIRHRAITFFLNCTILGRSRIRCSKHKKNTSMDYECHMLRTKCMLWMYALWCKIARWYFETNCT